LDFGLSTLENFIMPTCAVKSTCTLRSRNRRRLPTLLLACLLASTAWSPGARAGSPTLTFVDVTAAAGFTYQHGFVGLVGDDFGFDQFNRRISGGVAAGDYDRDGWIDVYAVRGDIGANLLFHNSGDGTFQEMASFAGVAVTGEKGSGPSFADIDGDGWLDLLINGVEETGARLFRNLGDGTFTEITSSSNLVMNRNAFSSAFGDFDLDGDLDILQSHWQHLGIQCTQPCTKHLWANNGSGVFTDMDTSAEVIYTDDDHTFTPNFADLDNDGLPDLLYSSDFGSTRVFLNDGDGTFTDVTDPAVFTDQYGMGSAIGDYDNDGDLDWFVSSIFDGETATGNRLYRNHGDGTFDDVTETAGVRNGYWGWGSCFADIDNDGNLDLFHVNGFSSISGFGDYSTDPSRLFMSNGDGTFTERSAELGLVDTGQGRGVICFDYDRDGDIDLFVANNSQAPALYRNDGGNANHFLSVHLLRPGGGPTVIGSRIYLTVGAVTQMREVHAGSNFVSQNPEEAHFGLGAATTVDQLQIQWPDGSTDIYSNVAGDQFLEIAPTRIFTDGFESGDVSAWTSAAPVVP
jgi:hypothetical protein